MRSTEQSYAIAETITELLLKYPHQRFGQILENYSRLPGPVSPFFYVDDTTLLTNLRRFG